MTQYDGENFDINDVEYDDKFEYVTPKPINNIFKIMYYCKTSGEVHYSINHTSFPSLMIVHAHVLEDDSSYIYFKKTNKCKTKHKFDINNKMLHYEGTQQDVEKFILKQLLITETMKMQYYIEDVKELTKWVLDIL